MTIFKKYIYLHEVYNTCHYFPCKKRFTTACCYGLQVIIYIRYTVFSPTQHAESNVVHCSNSPLQPPVGVRPFAVPMCRPSSQTSTDQCLVGYYPTNNLIRVSTHSTIFNLSRLLLILFNYFYLLDIFYFSLTEVLLKINYEDTNFCAYYHSLPLYTRMPRLHSRSTSCVRPVAAFTRSQIKLSRVSSYFFR